VVVAEYDKLTAGFIRHDWLKNGHVVYKHDSNAAPSDSVFRALYKFTYLLTYLMV